MQGWPCHAKVEVSTDEREQAGYGEATLLAEDSGRGGDERDIANDGQTVTEQLVQVLR